MCNFVIGLGLLDCAPAAHILHALLVHLGHSGEDPGAEATDAEHIGGAGGMGGCKHAAGAGPGTPACSNIAQGSGSGLVLEQFSSQELTDLVRGREDAHCIKVTWQQPPGIMGYIGILCCMHSTL